jgi:hypothetical protein
MHRDEKVIATVDLQWMDTHGQKTRRAVPTEPINKGKPREGLIKQPALITNHDRHYLPWAIIHLYHIRPPLRDSIDRSACIGINKLGVMGGVNTGRWD